MGVPHGVTPLLPREAHRDMALRPRAFHPRSTRSRLTETERFVSWQGSTPSGTGSEGRALGSIGGPLNALGEWLAHGSAGGAISRRARVSPRADGYGTCLDVRRTGLAGSGEAPKAPREQGRNWRRRGSFFGTPPQPHIFLVPAAGLKSFDSPFDGSFGFWQFRRP